MLFKHLTCSSLHAESAAGADMAAVVAEAAVTVSHEDWTEEDLLESKSMCVSVLHRGIAVETTNVCHGLARSQFSARPCLPVQNVNFQIFYHDANALRRKIAWCSGSVPLLICQIATP